MNGIKLHVTRNEQIQEAIVVVVAPRGTGGPTTESDTGFLCDIGKGAVVVVVIEAVLAEIGDIEVSPTVIVVISHGHAEAPTLIRYPGFVSDICERSVVVIMQ